MDLRSPALSASRSTASPPDGGFDEFYASTFASLVVQLTAYTRNQVEAQDAVQEAFVRAWPRWERLSSYEDPAAWVRRVAWNLATSRWRRGRVALRAMLTSRADHVLPAGPERVDLERALATLPGQQRR